MSKPDCPESVVIDNRLDSFNHTDTTLFLTCGKSFTPNDGTYYRLPVFCNGTFLSWIYTDIEMFRGSTLFTKVSNLMQFNVPTKEELKKKYGYLDTTDSTQVNFFSNIKDESKHNGSEEVEVQPSNACEEKARASTGV